MELCINTLNGPYKYKYRIVYEGIKVMDRKIAKENLVLFDKIAKNARLKYGMVYGTLLGAIREHDFIAHDEDIDLFILKEDLQTFKSLLFKLRDEGFEVIRYDRRDGLCSIMRKGEYIDFYIFSKLIPGVRETLGDPIPEKYLLDVKEYDFQGIQILAAKESEESMAFFYGESWNIPIATKPYEMSFIRKLFSIVSWWIYFAMPDFLFNIIMEQRAVKKAERYNMRAERLNNIVGKTIIERIPLHCYKIRK